MRAFFIRYLTAQINQYWSIVILILTYLIAISLLLILNPPFMFGAIVFVIILVLALIGSLRSAWNTIKNEKKGFHRYFGMVILLLLIYAIIISIDDVFRLLQD